MYSVIFLVEGFHTKSQRPFISPPNMSSVFWSPVNCQILSYLLISVWIKLKIQGQVTWLHLPLCRSGKWDTFLRLELCSGNQLLKMVFEMIFRVSRKETLLSLPDSREIDSWGLKPRVLESAARLGWEWWVLGQCQRPSDSLGVLLYPPLLTVCSSYAL